MEIERKFLIKQENLPINLGQYVCHQLEQGYLCTEPVVRIRKRDDEYSLTYKSKGFLCREEYNLPLTKEAYAHLKEKIDGRLIQKKRYIIPCAPFQIELDIFEGTLTGLSLAEVEFPDKKTAMAFTPPAWFHKEVTHTTTYQNNTLSQLTKAALAELMLHHK